MHIENADWSADGLAYFYWNRREMRRLDLVSGEDRHLFPLYDHQAMLVAPDGKTVYVRLPAGHSRRFVITNFGDRPRPPAPPQ